MPYWIQQRRADPPRLHTSKIASKITPDRVHSGDKAGRPEDQDPAINHGRGRMERRKGSGRHIASDGQVKDFSDQGVVTLLQNSVFKPRYSVDDFLAGMVWRSA